MADEHVSKIELEINGQSLEDFDSVEEPEYDTAKTVRLMNKTAFTKVTRRYEGGSLDYVIPSGETEFDFTQVVGGTLTIDRLDGTRIIYGGVWVTKIGKTKYDGDNVAKKPIEWSAQTRTEA